MHHSSTYAASFPGSGDKMITKYLVEGMTGLRVVEASSFGGGEGGDDASETSGGGEGGAGKGRGGKRAAGGVAVRTQWPHTSGKLASWDDDIHRAFVVLRNPLHAVPCYFDRLYELRNHLPTGSASLPQYSADSRNAWVNWRDKQLNSQMMLYRRFVSFWMERFTSKDEGSRLYFSYETFVDPMSGPGEASEGDVRKRRSIVDDEEEHRLLARNWNSAERPYLPENLAEMSQMLLELMNRWSRHQRLLSILAVYHREVNRAYLEITGQLDGAIVEGDGLSRAQQEQSLKRPQEKPASAGPSVLPHGSFHVIQASHPNANVASIVASNWLMGLFEPKKDIAFMNFDWPDEPIKQSGLDVVINSNLVTKTNKVDLLSLYKLIRPQFDEVFFVVSNRGRSRINDEVCGYKNVLCIEYEELRYDNVDELRAMVGMLTLKFRKRFEYFFGANNPDLLSPESERNAVERLDATALAAAALKDEPPEKVDLRYGVRGGDGFNMDDSVPALIMPSDRRLRRRLSIALPGGGCEVTWPQPPKRRIQTSYAASYPGLTIHMMLASWYLGMTKSIVL
ncbi:hypothetical protein ACHAXA_001196 [Cyclostephanos tholiformis]|uniref:Sulfotransferase n=1 Tax=Cyclostephanos tholiformis TaxID=382380 RepID=A0ABD3SQC7_9STRA